LTARRIIIFLIGILCNISGIFLCTNYFKSYISFFTGSFLFFTLGAFIIAVGLFLLIPSLHKIQFLYFGVILTAFGILELFIGFQALFFVTMNFSEFMQIGEVLIGGLFFTIGMVCLGCQILPYIITGLSYLFKPLLGFLRATMTRNILRYPRRTQNTFAMVALGLAFLIMISTFLSSISAGILPGAKLSVGGDMRIGWGSDYAPLRYTANLKGVNHVELLVPLRFVSSNCIIDEYSSDYYVDFIIINTTDYAKLHKEPTLLQALNPTGLSVDDFIHKLDQENSTILFYKLADALNKTVGDSINASSAEFKTTKLQIVGLCGRMPGVYYTYYEYSPPHYIAILSWSTFFKLTGYNMTSYPNLVGWVVGLDSLANDGLVRSQFTVILGQYRTVYEWDIESIRKPVEQYSGIINTIYVILTQILFIALIVSLLGLAITMNISIRQRRSEIGILRAIGISKRQILQMFFGETITISITGIFFGSITGIVIGYLLIYNFPFIEWMAVIFTIPWTTLGIYWTILLVVALLSSGIPAYNANKMNIIDMIRLRGR
jgi:putative ABC transport system permease protein